MFVPLEDFVTLTSVIAPTSTARRNLSLKLLKKFSKMMQKIMFCKYFVPAFVECVPIQNFKSFLILLKYQADRNLPSQVIILCQLILDLFTKNLLFSDFALSCFISVIFQNLFHFRFNLT